MPIEAVLLDIEKLLSNPILWGITAVLAIALALSGRVSMTAATWLVWIAWAMAAFGAYRASVYFGADVILRVLVVGAAAFTFAIGAVVLNRWFTAPKAVSGPPTVASPSPDVHSPAKNASPPNNPPPNQKSGTLQPVADLVGNLSALGWTVKRDSSMLAFEVNGGSLPSMSQSAEYFRQIHKPFRVRLQLVPNIDGLEHLRGIGNLQELGLNAIDLTNISQLSGFTSLRKLEISQVPFQTRAVIDTAPLAGLTDLTSLVLNSRISDLSPVAHMPRLQRLIMEGTLVRDLSPIRALSRLQVLDIRDSQVSDLSPASQLSNLEDLTIDTNQVRGLAALATLPILHKLTVIGQTPTDFSAIGGLPHLQSVVILGPPSINLGFASKLQSLTNLQVMGYGSMGFGPLTQASEIGSICAGGNLKVLSLGSLAIRSLDFVGQCKSLTELNLVGIPVESLAELSTLQDLKKISLVDVPVVEISPLLALPNLASLSLLRVPARADVLSTLEKKGVKVTTP